MLWRKWKRWTKDMHYTKYEIFPKISIPLGNAWTILREAMYVSISKRNSDIGSIVLDLKLWKTRVLSQTLLNNTILQPSVRSYDIATNYRLSGHVYVTLTSWKVNIWFGFLVITHYIGQSLWKSKAHNPLNNDTRCFRWHLIIHPRPNGDVGLA